MYNVRYFCIILTKFVFSPQNLQNSPLSNFTTFYQLGIALDKSGKTDIMKVMSCTKTRKKWVGKNVRRSSRGLIWSITTTRIFITEQRVATNYIWKYLVYSFEPLTLWIQNTNVHHLTDTFCKIRHGLTKVVLFVSNVSRILPRTSPCPWLTMGGSYRPWIYRFSLRVVAEN
jgi:hypothetical protein